MDLKLVGPLDRGSSNGTAYHKSFLCEVVELDILNSKKKHLTLTVLYTSIRVYT